MFKRILYGIVAMTALFHNYGFAQSGLWHTADSSLYKKKHPNCGLNKAYVLAHGVDTSIHTSGSGSASAIVIPTSFPAYAIDTCGKFQVFFEDKYLGTAEGFDDPSYGTNRRAVLCEVLSYIQNTYNFSSVPTGQYIRLQVSRSYTAGYPAPSGTTFTSIGSPYYSTGTGVTNGYVAEFVRTGSDPLAGHYHAQLQVNFDLMYSYSSSTWTSTPIDYFQTPSSTAISNCQIDLNSSLLHSVTHCLGWYSFVYSTIPPTGSGGIFSSIDTAAAITPAASTSTAPFSSIAKIVSGGTITHSGIGDWWMNSLNPPYNHPISTDGSTSLSHLSDGLGSYAYYQRISPGDWQEYVMTPYAINGNMRRVYTKGELETLKRTIGYNYTSSYAAAHSATIANHVPYSSKMFSDTFNHNYFVTAFNAFHEKMPADYTMTNDSGATVTIDLSTDSSLHDADGNTISVAAGTLINLRGCGVGGNNHNSLTLSAGNTRITYTPRHNFYGRAQLAFTLFDGIEKGAYVVYTIDVKKGTNVNVPFGQNLVLNGDFEEGTEVKTIGTNETITNTVKDDNGLHEGRFTIMHLGDSHPYDCFSQAGGFGGAVMIKNSYASCTDATVLKHGFGDSSASYPAPASHTTSPTSTIDSRLKDAPILGKRIGNTAWFDPGYYYLGKNLEKCHRYIIEFDVYRKYYYIATAVGYRGTDLKDSLKAMIGFTNDRAVNFAAFDWSTPSTWESPTLYHQLTPLPKYVLDSFSWQHIKIPFDYCSDSSANILIFNPDYAPGSAWGCAFDNLSIVEDSTFMKVKIKDSITTACNGHRLLADTSHVIFYRCDTAGAPLRYTWYKGTTIVGTTPSIFITSDATATTYRVVVSEGCRSATDSFVVPPLVGPIVSVRDTAICSGTSALLNVTVTGATGTVTYNWTPSTGLSCTTCATPIASPTTTTTYTLTVTDSLGCNTKSLTVTVNPTPTISVSPTSVTLCSGDSATLTASGGSSYVWSPTTGVSCSTCNPVKVSPPTSPYIYTVTGTNTYGCSGTATDTIKVGSCACRPIDVFGTTATTLATGTVPTTVTAGQYYIPANLTINSNTTMTGANILIAPNVTITVANNVKLTLDACHLFTCPDSNYMWNGIVLSSGATSARIEVKNNSMIEDAFVAINATNPKTPASGNIIDISNTVFNRNQRSVYIENYTPTVIGGKYPFSFTRTVFTARQFNKSGSGYPLFWAAASTLLGNVAHGTLPPYYIDVNYAKISPKAAVLIESGIRMKAVGNTSGTAYSEIVIGGGLDSTTANLFDNVCTGIYVENTNLSCYNNIFINLQPSGMVSLPPALRYFGAGIYTNSNGAIPNRLRVKEVALANSPAINKFFDCFAGINANSNYETDISYCRMSSSNVATNLMAKTGISVSTSRSIPYKTLNIAFNNISNIATGIFVNCDVPISTATTTIQYNTMAAFNPFLPSGTSTLGQNMNTAISVNSSYVPPISYTLAATISGNNMTNVFNGILASGMILPQANITASNTILLRELSTLKAQYGISVTNCIGATVNSNTISALSGSNVPNSDKIRGVYAANNTNLTVCSNTTNYIGRGFDFALVNPQSGTRWVLNSINYGIKGFTLGSDIGDQASMADWTKIKPFYTGAGGNTWNGFGGTKYETFVENTVKTTFSKLFVRYGRTPTESPALNYSFPIGYWYTSSTLIPEQRLANCLGGIHPIKTHYYPTAFAGTASLGMMILGDSLGYGTSYRPNQWIAQYGVYQSGLQDPSLKDSFALFNSFMNAAANSRFGWLSNIETALSNGNTATAQTLLSNPVQAMGKVVVNNDVSVTDYTEANYIVNNYTNYFTVYLHYLQGNMNASDTNALIALTAKCPATDGGVVYQARAFYGYLTGLSIVHDDDSCMYNVAGSTYRISKGTTEATQEYSLYPNPNNGSFVIRQSSVEDKAVSVKVYNAIGLMIYQTNTNFTNGTINVNLGQSPSGLYLVCIGDETKRTTCLRFVIK